MAQFEKKIPVYEAMRYDGTNAQDVADWWDQTFPAQAGLYDVGGSGQLVKTAGDSAGDVSTGYWIVNSDLASVLLPLSHDAFVKSYKPRSLDDAWAVTS